MIVLLLSHKSTPKIKKIETFPNAFLRCGDFWLPSKFFPSKSSLVSLPLSAGEFNVGLGSDRHYAVGSMRGLVQLPPPPFSHVERDTRGKTERSISPLWTTLELVNSNKIRVHAA